jgi:predicted NBD/HSP70 family sugar kinase
MQTLIRIGNRLKQEVPDGKPLAAGLASVGPIDLVQGSVTQSAFKSDWHNVQLRQPLAEALNLPVYMDNNATVAALGEFWYGMGRDYRNFLHITFFGNGLGGGLFLDRRVYRGAGLNTAEFGHVLVYPEKQIRGVAPFLENYVSGYALQRDLGESILDEIPERIRTQEKKLSVWMDMASDLFAKALVSVDHMLNLDAIIVGGQLPSEFIEELLKRISPRLDEYYMPGWSERASLRQCSNGDDNAILGAATLPIYDVLAMTAHGSGTSTNLFKSDAEGGLMQ